MLNQSRSIPFLNADPEFWVGFFCPPRQAKRTRIKTINSHKKRLRVNFAQSFFAVLPTVSVISSRSRKKRGFFSGHFIDDGAGNLQMRPDDGHRRRGERFQIRVGGARHHARHRFFELFVSFNAAFADAIEEFYFCFRL